MVELVSGKLHEETKCGMTCCYVTDIYNLTALLDSNFKCNDTLMCIILIFLVEDILLC
jgi:hypothetical protein